MTAFAGLDELVNRLSGGNSGLPQFLTWHKESRVAGALATTPQIGFPISSWEYEGTPSHGAVPPTTTAYPDNTTQGGWKQNNPGGGRQLWATAIGGQAAFPGTLVLCDRLSHISGMSGTVTTAQTVGASAITRYTNGLGNFIYAEIYTLIGVTPTTITASYTNQAGTSAQVTQAVAIGNTGRREAQRFFELSTAASDTGVQAVASATVLATTGTAGNFGVGIAHKLVELTINANCTCDIRSYMDGPLQEVLTNACLFWYFLPATVSAPNFEFTATLVER